ncbi:putative alanine and proline rich protein [Mycobacteroides abscessus subsp. massiliense]|uniref:Alanine and proline rich protein n=1 Tax=Mycobacteroides abscessus subsp. bolletii 50594 TaxID=1303024 RepID=A0AB33A8J5_9MYCO|nr:DUF3375 domain-containing protein [Mycobacteroides abscessus]AGM28084.1 hypothetical protein MASS_1482 [Mycobacteroides abscessus subsp. bolletii 50594]SKF89943.1 putative alanine and proline rich protein [Mycobacteroides abscessus subsp. massiliense]SKH16941.1 putative alanine and proline rich protein [Mycobacteroides abscessus subsp. massiliense]SKJ35991.1 putative alanine and proline rich protein [Mycobacteroides abscessus subsp. massiliense]SKJ72925.1 putative alanine and proline rich p
MNDLTVEELFAHNDDVQKSRAVRLLAAKNLAPYITLMERHLDRSAKVSEPQLVAKLDRDLSAVGLGEQSGLALIKSWASDGWLHRASDGTGPDAENVCSLTEDARSALAFVRRLRRADTVATGGSIAGIAAGLKRVATQLDGDPSRLRADIEAQIAELQTQLHAIDDGYRPEPDIVDLEDETRAIAYQMEQVITDIVRYGSMQNEITAGLIDAAEDSDSGFRDRARRMFADYDALFDSRERASYSAFTRTIQDPDQRAALRSDIACVAEGLPDLDPGLREVMRNFFKLVSQQIAEVSRIEQRCAQRIRRFFAAGTTEQARGRARQLNDALAAGHALLKMSTADSPIDAELPIGRSAAAAIGALSFTIKDTAPPVLAQDAPSGPLDLSGFSALATQVDMAALADTVNSAIAGGPVSLPDMISHVEAPYLGDVIVLWSLALKQDNTADRESVKVKFRSLDGQDRVMEVPQLMFREPVLATLEEEGSTL